MPPVSERSCALTHTVLVFLCRRVVVLVAPLSHNGPHSRGGAERNRGPGLWLPLLFVYLTHTWMQGELRTHILSNPFMWHREEGCDLTCKFKAGKRHRNQSRASEVFSLDSAVKDKQRSAGGIDSRGSYQERHLPAPPGLMWDEAFHLHLLCAWMWHLFSTWQTSGSIRRHFLFTGQKEEKGRTLTCTGERERLWRPNLPLKC